MQFSCTVNHIEAVHPVFRVLARHRQESIDDEKTVNQVAQLYRSTNHPSSWGTLSRLPCYVFCISLLTYQEVVTPYTWRNFVTGASTAREAQMGRFFLQKRHFIHKLSVNKQETGQKTGKNPPKKGLFISPSDQLSWPSWLFLAAGTTDTKFRHSTGVATANSTNKDQKYKSVELGDQLQCGSMLYIGAKFQ